MQVAYEYCSSHDKDLKNSVREQWPFAVYNTYIWSKQTSYTTHMQYNNGVPKRAGEFT